MKYRIDYVRLASGRVPFIRFLDDLSDAERAEVLAAIEELREWRERDMIPPSSISSHLRDGIFELKVRHANRITRSLYFYSAGAMIVFTHGFVKKTRKAPPQEIEKALRYRSQYNLS